MPEESAARAELRCAREGRSILAEALSVLQIDPAAAGLSAALEHVARASSVLYELENGPTSRVSLHVRAAMSHLTSALDELQHAPESEPGSVALESVARTLALLYPVARAQHRQRKRVVVSDLEETDSMPFWPSVPEPLGQPPERAEFAGGDRRAAGERIFLEVEVGLCSDSQFFVGLSRDLSDGGLFVATYAPRPVGTPVALHFVLPGGRAVLAKGVVRWTQTSSGRRVPGMGVAFEQLSAEDLLAIQTFCRERMPLEPPHDDV